MQQVQVQFPQIHFHHRKRVDRSVLHTVRYCVYHNDTSGGLNSRGLSLHEGSMERAGRTPERYLDVSSKVQHLKSPSGIRR